MQENENELSELRAYIANLETEIDEFEAVQEGRTAIAEVLQNKHPWHIETGNSLTLLKAMPENSIHCVVTSPPYWSLRDYGVEDQAGLEETPEEYIEKMVEVFREVRRVLREDGTCWLNIGDAYATIHKGTMDYNFACSHGTRFDVSKIVPNISSGLAAKNLIGLPWRLAFALQNDGWILRADIIWAKPNPMPEPVTDRPTKSHEYVFLLTKSKNYFFDEIAVREESKTVWNSYTFKKQGTTDKYNGLTDDQLKKLAYRGIGSHHEDRDRTGRNLRSVWTINVKSYRGAHFATFPFELPQRCILAGTSDKGTCEKCDAPWVHVTEDRWKPNCDCYGFRTPVKIKSSSNAAGIVLDPFSGAGTTGLVARRLGRRYIG